MTGKGIRINRKRLANMTGSMQRYASTVPSAGIQYDTQQLTPELRALIAPEHHQAFLEALNNAQERFYPRYVAVRESRQDYQSNLRAQNAAGNVDYRADTKWIREADWKVAPVPEVLSKRPVELTGPANDKGMMINAFNTGALAKNVVPSSDPTKPLVKYMPDGEDSSVPNLAKELQGILNLKEALQGTLSYTKKGADGSVKSYSLGKEIAYPIYRVPGLHFDEATVVDKHNRPIPNHLLLTLLYQYHVAPLMKQKGWVPSLYQPKLQSFEEAQLVNDVLAFSEKSFGIAEKSTRVTCLIETLSGALQAEEIVYGLKDYLAGLNAGRWDYIFQWIQVLQNVVTPDRSKITMQTKHMEAYLDHIRDVCERRGAVFMGGMSALIPNPKTGAEVLEKISKDKKHEQLHGAQGAWVAHPGMVEQVLRLFTVEKDQVKPLPRRSVQAKELVTLEGSLQEPSQRTEKGIVDNVSVGVQYLASWISGRGAVALNNLMEDMATAEISRAQLWQWRNNKVTFTRADGSVATLTPELLDEIFDRVVKDLAKNNEVGYAAEHLPRAAELFREMIKAQTLDNFIADRAYGSLNTGLEKPTPKKSQFSGIGFDQQLIRELLPGSQHHGEELVKMRSRYLREYFDQCGKDGHPRQFWFAGTSNPLVGSATVLGGGGSVGSYLGGWDANAVNNVLNKRLPDTLNVWVNDSSNGAKAINNHLRRDMELDNLDYYEALAAVSEAERSNVKTPFNWLAVPQLVDLEQGWRSIHHTRLAVDAAIDNGINVMHIEDQGHHKRCGHLGDKELAPFDSYCQVLRSANLTATLRLGDDQQKGLGVIFVARTDALSAKRIEFSEKLKDPSHLDHPFIDFARGLTADGNYYYLKQGINPATGNSYGLDLAATRSAEVVRLGLAEYVWMETPNADLHVAKAFIDSVNARLAPHNKFAKMLYNHSPSFDWDLGFVKGAIPLGDGLIKHIETEVAPQLRRTLGARGELGNWDFNNAYGSLRGFIEKNGDPIQRDYDFRDDTLREILTQTLDLNATDADHQQAAKIVKALKGTMPTSTVDRAVQVLQESAAKTILKTNVYRAIADARLGLFGKASAAVGVELPLTTLPDFHYEAFNAHRLAMGLVTDSMQAYVRQVQRPERQHFEAQKGTSQPYPFYKHQNSTGTGVDAHFGKALGSSDVNALSDSTESDDLRDRQALEADLH